MFFDFISCFSVSIADFSGANYSGYVRSRMRSSRDVSRKNIKLFRKIVLENIVGWLLF